jgi:hypothetical protein
MKFSIRDVLWLTVVVALAVCWALDRAALHRAELRARMEAERAMVHAELARAQAQLAEFARAQTEVLRASEGASVVPETTEATVSP